MMEFIGRFGIKMRFVGKKKENCYPILAVFYHFRKVLKF